MGPGGEGWAAVVAVVVVVVAAVFVVAVVVLDPDCFCLPSFAR